MRRSKTHELEEHRRHGREPWSGDVGDDGVSVAPVDSASDGAVALESARIRIYALDMEG